MPRKRKPYPTPAGGGGGTPIPQGAPPPNPTQAPAAPTGMPYGEHQAAMAGQEMMPLPNNDPMAQIGQAMEQFVQENTPLEEETGFPDEPITTGMAMGPGAGPDVLRMQQDPPAAAVLTKIADVTGDPVIRAMADRARLRGR
jgi:hypothetical protein